MRILWLTAILGWTLWQAPVWIPATLEQHSDSQANRHLESQELSIKQQLAKTTASIVYELQAQHWTDFPLLPNAFLIKIVSNANIKADTLLDDAASLHYVLQYQIVDAKGKILLAQDYHQRSRLDVVAANSLRPLFYLEQTDWPTQGRFLLLNLQQLTAQDLLGARLRLRYHSDDPKMVNVIARVYSLENAELQRLGYSWQRLSEKQRQALAEKTLYPPDLLHPQEKNHLLRQHWTVLGPAGIFNQDYFSRHLYQLSNDEWDDNNNEETQETMAALPQGLYIDAQQHVTLPIATASKLNASLTPLNAEQKPVLFLRHYDVDNAHHEQHSEQAIVGLFDEGLLDLSSTQPAWLRIIAVNGQQNITPELLQSKVYLIEAGQTLNYKIQHPVQAPQSLPLRLLVRRLLNRQADNPTTCQLHYQGQNLDLDATLSAYDRTTGDMTESHRLSQVQRYYLQVPVNQTKIQFSADCPVLLSVYNRPPSLAQWFVHDNDKVLLNQDLLWFRLLPENADNAPSLMIAVQTPPLTAEEAAPVQQEWESFTPLNPPPARYILTAREDKGQAVDKSALTVYYRQFNANQTINVRLDDMRPTVQPRLVFYKKDKQSVDLQVVIDGKNVLKSTIYSRQGEIELPEMLTGAHQIQCKISGKAQATPVQFYLNQTPPQAGSMYLKRLIYPLNPQGLRFSYHKSKTQAAVLSARVYWPLVGNKPAELKVNIIANNPKNNAPLAHSWTFTERYHRFIRPKQPASLVLNNQHIQLDAGHFFVIPLQEDLPVGNYTLHITPLNGASGYLSLGQQRLKSNQWRLIFQENAAD